MAKRVQLVPLPSVQDSGAPLAGAAQSQLGRDISGAGREAQRAAGQFQQLIDATNDAAMKGAYADYVAYTTDSLDNPETGLVTKKGKSAAKAGKKSVEALDKWIEKYGKETLSNEDQRAAFKAFYRQQKPSYTHSVNGHVTRENAEWIAEKEQAVLGASTASAVGHANRGELDEIGDDLMVADLALENTAQREGWDAETLDRERKVQATSTHLAVLDAMLRRGDVGSAQEWFKESKGDMDAKMVNDSGIKGRLHAGNLKQQGQDIADSIMEQTTTVERGVVVSDRVKGLELMRAMNLPVEVFDEARARLDRGYDDNRVALDAHDDPIYANLVQRLYFPQGEPEPTFNDDEAMRLSPDRYTRWISELVKKARLDGRDGIEKQRNQREIDAAAFDHWRGRRKYGVEGQDQFSGNPSLLYPRASDRAHSKMRNAKNDLIDRKEQGQDVEYKAFLDLVEPMIAKHISGRTNRNKVQAFVNREWDALKAAQPDPRRGPGVVEARELARRLFRQVDTLIISDVIPIIGGLSLGSTTQVELDIQAEEEERTNAPALGDIPKGDPRYDPRAQDIDEDGNILFWNGSSWAED